MNHRLRGPLARHRVRRTLPFSLNRSLLNFMGYAGDRTVDFIDPKITRSMLGQALESAAVRHRLIERSTYRIGYPSGSNVIPFKATGAEIHGYKLTRYGRVLARIGKRAREAKLANTAQWAPFIQEAQFRLDEAIRESNARVA